MNKATPQRFIGMVYYWNLFGTILNEIFIATQSISKQHKFLCDLAETHQHTFLKAKEFSSHSPLLCFILMHNGI